MTQRIYEAAALRQAYAAVALARTEPACRI